MTFSLSSNTAGRTLLTIVAGLLVAHLGVTMVGAALQDDNLFGMRAFLDVNEERSLPTWYSVLQLATSALLLALIGSSKRRKGDRFTMCWWVLSLGFVYLSLDEGLLIHERTEAFMAEFIGSLSSVFRYAWVVLAGSVVAALFVCFIPFLRSLPPAFRWRFMAAGACFLGGALGVELVAGSLYDGVHSVRPLGERVLQTLEEGMEMSGIALFISALLAYIASEMGAISLRIGAEHGAAVTPLPIEARSSGKLRAI